MEELKETLLCVIDGEDKVYELKAGKAVSTLTRYFWLPCSLGHLTVNGIEADDDDFVKPVPFYDDDEQEEESDDEVFDCTLVYEPFEPTQEMLDKYRLSKEEYSALAAKFAEYKTTYHCSCCE